MNQSSTLSNSDLLRIESICDQFEADRRAGKCPTIESYSQFVGRDSDYRLVGELLRVEWDDRAEKGDPPKLEEYLKASHNRRERLEVIPCSKRERERGEKEGWPRSSKDRVIPPPTQTSSTPQEESKESQLHRMQCREEQRRKSSQRRSLSFHHPSNKQHTTNDYPLTYFSFLQLGSKRSPERRLEW